MNEGEWEWGWTDENERQERVEREYIKNRINLRNT